MPFSEITFSRSISTTEWSLVTDTSGPDAEASECIVQPFVDVFPILAGDVFRFRVYEKVVSGGTQRIVEEVVFQNNQTTAFVFPALHMKHGWDMTLQKLSGTDRTIAWSLRLIT